MSAISPNAMKRAPLYLTEAPSHGQIVFVGKYPLFMGGAILAAWGFGLTAVFAVARGVLNADFLVIDTHAYWLAAQGELVYDRMPGQRDAYLYSPLFLTAIRPLAMLPWPAFLATWICLQTTVLVWLLRPLCKKWAIPLFLCCLPELAVGNIHVLLAGAAVLGMRRPGVWALPILTKVTAGVGLLWFAFRSEWRRLLTGVVVTVAIVGGSYVIDPAPWHAWMDFLMGHRKGTPDSSTSFVLRCLVAVGLVALGTRKNWPWLIAPAMVLASPVLTSVIALSMLAAIPRLAMASGPTMEASPHFQFPSLAIGSGGGQDPR